MHRTMAVTQCSLTEEVRRVGPGATLIGIVTAPPAPGGGTTVAAGEPVAAGGIGVVFLNAGVIHRVGPNRVYVRMARALGRRGIPGLRFDLSGVGDSPSGNDPDVLRRWIAEARHAIDCLVAATGVRGVVLAGHCSGAALAFLTAVEDRRVVGAALVNPQPRSSVRYFLRLAATHPNFWRRLLRGGARYGMAAARVTGRTPYASHAAAARAHEDIDTILRRGCRVLLVSCEWDASYDGVYRPLRRRYARPSSAAPGPGPAASWPALAPGAPSPAPPGTVDFALIRGANHDFSTVASQDRLVETVCGWVATVAAAGAGSGPCAEGGEGRR